MAAGPGLASLPPGGRRGGACRASRASRALGGARALQSPLPDSAVATDPRSVRCEARKVKGHVSPEPPSQNLEVVSRGDVSSRPAALALPGLSTNFLYYRHGRHVSAADSGSYGSPPGSSRAARFLPSVARPPNGSLNLA